MQEVVTTNLTLAMAKIELKQLEVIDKLSERHDDFVIRCITCPLTSKFLAVNGDWEKVTGFKETLCVGMSFKEFIPDYDDLPSSLRFTNGFVSYSSDLITKDGSVVEVDWKTKHFEDIDASVTIGRVKR